MNLLLHVVINYGFITCALLACLGWGHAIFEILRNPEISLGQPALSAALKLVIGSGFIALLLQIAGVIGILDKGSIACIGALGWACVVRSQIKQGFRRKIFKPNLELNKKWLPYSILVLLTVPTLIAPLGPPLAWDEVMYHLPHAREWATSGHLTLNQWLRYPSFPYNFDLLFSAALAFDNDVLPHLIHAAAGWIIAWLIFEIGERYGDRVIGILSAALWIYLSRENYSRAYVDLGVTLWFFSAAIAFWFAWENHCKDNKAWWLISAFLLGAALGAKYQIIISLPFFAFAMVYKERSKKVWLCAAVSLALPCGYWYLRNYLILGDPVAPLGSSIFGDSDWNRQDLLNQFEDLRKNIGWPPVLFIGAIFAFGFRSIRNEKIWQAAGALSLFQLLGWSITSRYPRYLLPTYPLLVLLTVIGWRRLYSSLIEKAYIKRDIFASRSVSIVLLILTAWSSVNASKKSMEKIAYSDARREEILIKNIPGYAVLQTIEAKSVKKLYQLGIEDSIYYMPRPVWGEVFGRWRYSDYSNLESEALNAKLEQQNFDAIIVHKNRFPHVVSRDDWQEFFEILATDDNVALYRVISKK